MMDKLNIVQKTVMALILATMVLLVAVPLLAFTTVAFSNSVEMTEFPKRLIPKRTVTVRVAPTPEGNSRFSMTAARAMNPLSRRREPPNWKRTLPDSMQ